MKLLYFPSDVFPLDFSLVLVLLLSTSLLQHIFQRRNGKSKLFSTIVNSGIVLGLFKFLPVMGRYRYPSSFFSSISYGDLFI